MSTYQIPTNRGKMPAGKKRRRELVMTAKAKKAVTDEQLGQFARRIRDLQERVERGTVPYKGMMDRLQAFIEGRPLVSFEAASLDEILASQTTRLIEIGAHKQIGLVEAKYREEAEAAIVASSWSPELAAIGLNEIALVDFRLSGRFLAEAGGVTCYDIDPDECVNYQGVVTPTDQILVIQGQWGSKHRNKAPCWCREHLHELEQGCVVKEGLTVLLYKGERLLQDCYIDLPGSENGHVPCLFLNGDGPHLRGANHNDAGLMFGSASRGRN